MSWGKWILCAIVILLLLAGCSNFLSARDPYGCGTLDAATGTANYDDC